MNEPRGKRKIRRGWVVSDRMQKTAMVEVQKVFPHPLYKKVVKKVTRLKIHDRDNQARVGDFVEIAETRPISKTKRWRLVRVIRSAAGEAATD